MQRVTSTDLHLQFKMDSGEHFQWDSWDGDDNNHTGSAYHATSAYKVKYAQWLEENYLNLLNSNK